jgi:hypothetical protein
METSMRRRVHAALIALIALACTVVAAGCAPQARPAAETIGFSGPGAPADRAVSATDRQKKQPNAAPATSLAAAPTAPAGSAGAPGSLDGRAALPEDFPAGTRSLAVTETAHVLSAPLDRAPYIGKVIGGTRVEWKRVVAPDPEAPEVRARHHRRGEPCEAWVEIAPRGFLCKALLAASRDEPHGVRQPVVPTGRLTPDDYFKVMADETKVYKSADDVRAEAVDKLVSKKVMLVGESVLHIDETPYLKTDHGLIEAAALGKFWPSDFAGINLREHPTTLPFAWVFFERGGRKVPVYPSPDTDDKAVRTAARREIVSLLEEKNGFVRIAEGEWIERKHLRVASITAPPRDLAPGAQWIDVDLDEQALVLYEGSTPVFATLVSTGGKKNPTPPATYRVRAKAATTAMAGDPRVPNRYEVSAVPWAVRFADGFFVHGVYWHDGFGGARSHGCVNVSPKDAAFIFDWIAPAVPDGWSEVEVLDNSGAIVRVHDHQILDPPPFDYSKEKQAGEKPSNRF